MKLLLTYPPFCTPATPPYSITNIGGFLKKNTNEEIILLDLNEAFHNLKFPKEKIFFKNQNQINYEVIASEYNNKTKICYSENNKKVRNNECPEFFNELLALIINKKPDCVAFSIVYSSQVFYAYKLIQELKKINIKTIVGGPAVSEKLSELSSLHLKDEIELLGFLDNFDLKKDKNNRVEISYDYDIDYSNYNLENYFIKEIVLPIKTSSTCYYKQCAFCSHFSNIKYKEYDKKWIEKTIIKNKTKNYFIIDDMIHPKRLLELAEIFKKNKVVWSCQLKPTIDFTYEVLLELKNSGLKFVAWGVESGNNNILKKMNKGTNNKDIAEVLQNSKKAGIINVVYILFGFPTETEESFISTIDFLKDNNKNIDLISSSIFGLQENTIIFNNPKDYGIIEIKKEKRSLLGDKITYKIINGISNIEASQLKRKYSREITKINKYPNSMNFFREHLFFV